MTSSKVKISAIEKATAEHLTQVFRAGVVLHRTQADAVRFALDVTGGNAQFAFSCKHRQSIQKSDPANPENHYQWMLKIGDTDTADDMYAVGFLFIGAPQYRLVIDHIDSGGNVIEPLQDRTFQGKDDDPPQFATIHVVVV